MADRRRNKIQIVLILQCFFQISHQMKYLLILIILIAVSIQSLPLIIPGTDTILIGRIDRVYQIDRQCRICLMDIFHNSNNIITIFCRIFRQSVGSQEQFHCIWVKSCLFRIIFPVKTASLLIVERLYLLMWFFHGVRCVCQIVSSRKTSSGFRQGTTHTTGSHIDNLIIRQFIEPLIRGSIAGQTVTDSQQ